MRVAAALLVGLALCATPALAQPLPASLRSAGVTEVQWRQAQGVIRAQATSLSLREEAVRTLAVEIFEGQPDLSFEACLDLIREGARRLPELVATARALDPGGDPVLADLQDRAVTAAEAGRLNDAQTLQDEFNAALERAIERATEQPLLQLAAGLAASGQIAYSRADYLVSAERYAAAADRAPASAVELRWKYRLEQGRALVARGRLFGEPEPLREAVRVLSEEALPLAPRSRPQDRIATLREYANALRSIGDDYMPGAYRHAVRVYDSILPVVTREADPELWAGIHREFGLALLKTEEFDRAITAFRAAQTVWTREADAREWAIAEAGIASALRHQSEFDAAIAAYEAVLSVFSVETEPYNWATTQTNLANVHLVLDLQGVPGAIEKAIAGYHAALTIYTPDTDPAVWALTQFNLGLALRRLSEHGNQGAREREIAAYESALTYFKPEHTWAYPFVESRLAEAYLSQGRIDDARAAARAALPILEQVAPHDADRMREFLSGLPID
ncbi:MAG: hypothetical protein AB7T59_03580 [Hyphomonadaceae bacterium]